MVTIRENGTYPFLISWTVDPKIIIAIDFYYLTLVEKEVIQDLEDFEDISSRAMVSIDQEEESEIEKYLGEFVVNEAFILILFILNNNYDFLVLYLRIKCLE